MPEESLRYDKMVEDALRGVVRDALIQTAETGLFGDHHFYITFRTRLPGVHLPVHIMARHPEEMTIVLQHQYWDLDVTEDSFAVTLSFSGASERLHIPFAAITGFADPSAKFGLQFQVEDEDGNDEDDDLDEAETAEFEPEALDDIPPEGAKVIALDAFRKK